MYCRQTVADYTLQLSNEDIVTSDCACKFAARVAWANGTPDSLWVARPGAHVLAAQRDLPNLSVVTSLLEDFHVDVNERTWGSEYDDFERYLVYDNSALHYVAQGLRWWHVYHTMKYLLKAPGIDLNLQIKDCLTPLHMAIKGRVPVCNPRPYSYDSVKCLLEAGVDIHAVAKGGESCLSMAKHDIRTIRLLIKHRAIISPEDIVSAVEAGRTDILRALFHARDDDGECLDLDLVAPLQAASLLFYKPTEDNYVLRLVVDNAIVIEMIEILIEYRVNPLSDYFFIGGDDSLYLTIRSKNFASTFNENAKYQILLYFIIIGVREL